MMATPRFWTILAFILVFHSAECQYFQVTSSQGLEYEPTCGLEDGSGTWQFLWRLYLHSDLKGNFQRSVRVETTSELCSIDLDNCEEPADISNLTDVCYCKKYYNNHYDLVTKRLARVAESSAPLTVYLPFIHECNPEALPKLLGILPPVYSDKTPLTATYTIDGGVTTTLGATQTVSACNMHYVELTVCVYHLVPEYSLTLTTLQTGQSTKVTSENCIHQYRRFDFSAHSVYELQLSYFENTWCPRSGTYTILFQETEIECSPEPCDEPEYTSCEPHSGALPRQRATLPDIGEVLCDTVTDGGNWTIVQRREEGDLNFYRRSIRYINGFGNFNGDFWLGLERIHQFCYEDPYCELRLDFEFEGSSYYATYSEFYIDGQANNYKLHVSGYSGDAGDSLTYHDNYEFSTFDQDHDSNGGNCAEFSYGAWWYRNCHYSNLNGRWNSTDYGTGLVWQTLTGMRKSLSLTEIKVRKN